MAKKKLRLSELKVKSFITSLPLQQRKKAKGGYVRIPGRLYVDYQHGQFTDHKSQLAPATPGNLIDSNPIELTGNIGK